MSAQRCAAIVQNSGHRCPSPARKDGLCGAHWNAKYKARITVPPCRVIMWQPGWSEARRCTRPAGEDGVCSSHRAAEQVQEQRGRMISKFFAAELEARRNA